MSITLDETIVGVSIRRLDLGAVGDGVTDDAQAFANLALSTRIEPDELLILPKGVYRIGSSQTVTHPVYFQRGAVLKPDAGVTLTLARSFDAGIARIFDGDGTIAIAPGAVAEAYPQWWGAAGDGTADDGAAVEKAADAVEASGGELVFPGGAYRFATSRVLRVGARLPRGAELRPDEGATLTLSGIDAGLYRVFGGDGAVAFTPGRVVEVYPQWWGAVADGTADDGPAVQRALAALSGGALRLVFPAGAYRFADSRSIGQPVRLLVGAELRPDAGATVTLSGLDAEVFRVFGGAGTVTFAPGSLLEAYPQWWGAEADGTADDGPAVQRAAEALWASGTGELLFPGGAYRFSTGQAIGRPARLFPGAELRPDAGAELTLTGIQAGIYRVFGGEGTIRFSPGTLVEAYPQWWGAVGDGVEDDGAVVGAAADAVAAGGGELVFPAGAYRVAGGGTLGARLRLLPGAELRPDPETTLTLAGIDAGLYRVFGGGGAVVLAPGAVAEAYPQWWGAAGDGTADDAAAVAAAAASVAAGGAGLVFPAGAYRFASNQTLAAPVRLLPGAVLSPDEGVTLGLAAVEAGLYQIFSGLGQTSFTAGLVADAYPQWWGALGDGAADDRPALAAAEAALAGGGGGELVFPRGAYPVSASLALATRVRLVAGAELRPGAGVTLTLSGGFEAPPRRAFGGAGSVAFAAGTVEAVHPQWWGALGDGAADDGPALQAAAAAVEADDAWIELPRGSYRLAASLAFPRPVRFRPGARIAPDAGTTATFSAPVDAGVWRIFDGAGAVALAAGKVSDAFPQWWGAAGDGAADDGPAVEAAATALGACGGVLVFPGGTYRFGATRTLGSPVRLLRGAELRPDAGTVLTLAGIDAPLLKVFGGAGTVAFAKSKVVEVFPQWWGAVGDGTTDDAPALRLAVASLAASAGGRIFLPAGTYLIDSLDTPGVNDRAGVNITASNVEVTGAGPTTVLQAGPGLDAAGIDSYFILSLQGDLLPPYVNAVRNVTVSEIRVVGRGTVFPFPSGIHGAPGTEGVIVRECRFENLGFYGAVDLSSSTKGKIESNVATKCAVAYLVSGTTVTHSVDVTDNHAINCFCAVSIQYGEGCQVKGNLAYYDTGFTASNASWPAVFHISGQRGCVVLGNTVDARNVPPAVTVPIGFLLGNDFGASANPGFGYPSHCKVVANTVLGAVARGIQLKGATECVLADNTIGDRTSTRKVGNGIEITQNVGTGAKSYANLIRDNVITADLASGYGIVEVNGQAYDNDISGNALAGAVPLTLNTTQAPTSTVRYNRGYKTEASGEATIAAAATSVTVNPGIAEPLVRKNIRITPVNSMNSATKFRVVNVTATTFDIAVDVAPGLSGASFAWAYHKA